MTLNKVSSNGTREQKIVLNGLMVQEKALEFATATELVESLVYHNYLMRNIHKVKITTQRATQN